MWLWYWCWLKTFGCLGEVINLMRMFCSGCGTQALECTACRWESQQDMVTGSWCGKEAHSHGFFTIWSKLFVLSFQSSPHETQHPVPSCALHSVQCGPTNISIYSVPVMGREPHVKDSVLTWARISIFLSNRLFKNRFKWDWQTDGYKLNVHQNNIVNEWSKKWQNPPKWSVNSNPSLSTGNVGFVVAISSKLYEVRDPDFKNVAYPSF